MGAPAPGNGGTNEGRRPKNRPSDTKGRRPNNRPAKGGTLEATWVRGEGTREPWRRGATDFLQVVAATAGGTERAPLAAYLVDGIVDESMGYSTS